MSLLDEALTVHTAKGPPCAVTSAYTKHPEITEDLDELLQALNDGRIFASVASRTLRAHDIEISAASLRRHTDGDCKCR